jgi:hypothetical protein
VFFNGTVGRSLKEHLVSQRKRNPEKFLFTTENGKLLEISEKLSAFLPI